MQHFGPSVAFGAEWGTSGEDHLSISEGALP
jgi:hypothetical protein